MIYGNLNNKDMLKCLPEAILKVFDYASKNDLQAFELGKHEIDGEKVFVNIVQYDTTTVESRFWEAHKKYLDIHFMLQGKERINLNFKDNLSFKKYVEEDDFLEFEGDENSTVVLEKDDFLICYPEDIHMTCLKADEKESNVKKAIYKVIL